MHDNPVPELLGPPHAPEEQTTIMLLRHAIAVYSKNRMQAIRAIARLQATDPTGLARAALQLLLSADEKSPGLKYAADLLMAGSLLAELLLNRDILTLDAAESLARKVTWVEPFLDVCLVRYAVANAAGKVGAIKSAEALYVLELVDAISDCSRLGSYLIQFLNHPNDKVRSKAALMLGRSNWNLTRIESLLASDDGRLRANAVESLWGHRNADVKKILWNATQDPSGRVVVNALLGLCRAGDHNAYLRLAELAETPDPVLRSGAAWAMGETGDLQFEELLQKLVQDGDARVRVIAGKSQKKLRKPELIVSPPPKSPTHMEESDTESSPIESAKGSPDQKPGWLSGNKARG
jgi:HEAT repeat protein